MSRNRWSRVGASWQLRVVVALTVALAVPQRADACAVPVFRYALERWAADLFEVDVFYRGSLTAEEQAAVSQLEDQSQINGGATNWEVVHCNLDDDLADDLQAVGKAIGDVALPHVVLRRPGGRRGSAVVWSGPLLQATPDLWASPARSELIRRLANGDSVVWLVFRGADDDGYLAVVEKLKAQLPTLAAEIPLPPGVGLPGSELLTRLPLEVRFSMLEVDGQAPDEAIFRALVASGASELPDPAETLVVPVFGRGRAMTVLSADRVDEEVLAECCGFLCGACSCQVKQSNPGFDLLLAVNWDERLLGDAEADPGAAVVAASMVPVEEPSEPAYVAIPPGRSKGIEKPVPLTSVDVVIEPVDPEQAVWQIWAALSLIPVTLLTGLALWRFLAGGSGPPAA